LAVFAERPPFTSTDAAFRNAGVDARFALGPPQITDDARRSVLFSAVRFLNGTGFTVGQTACPEKK
jgi:hypothetical protein